MADGDYDFVILLPVCASWSRAHYSGRPGPDPIQSKNHSWGLPDNLKVERDKIRLGNAFIHASIRMIRSAVRAGEQRGQIVHIFLEQPKDLGITSRGIPASI